MVISAGQGSREKAAITVPWPCCVFVSDGQTRDLGLNHSFADTPPHNVIATSNQREETGLGRSGLEKWGLGPEEPAAPCKSRSLRLLLY
jgi:hypothetical protein